ncbi:Pantothenate synthetase [Tumidithrix helvetica PCC 7403]
MGALHRGHFSLIERARQENDCVVVSIFVNPLQFGVGEDLDKYPRTLDRDQQLCQSAGVDAIFAPSAQEIGAQAQLAIRSGITQVLPPPEMTEGLCGRSRSGHFTGVATIVTKLLQIVQPDRAYFGQKDGQQLAILRKLIKDLNIPVEVIGCPTVREPDGLALSSRNQYLAAPQREAATALYQALRKAAALFQQGIGDRDRLVAAVRNFLAARPLITVEYVELVDALSLQPLNSAFALPDDSPDASSNSSSSKVNQDCGAMLAIAAHVGTTRLIDNILLNPLSHSELKLE